MGECVTGVLAGIGAEKKKSTPELRLLFDQIESLRAEGFTQKQIWSHLNSNGLNISYSYYRLVMTRLRAERAAKPAVAPSPVEREAVTKNMLLSLKTHGVRSDNENDSAPAAPTESLTWDPGAPVKSW